MIYGGGRARASSWRPCGIRLMLCLSSEITVWHCPFPTETNALFFFVGVGTQGSWDNVWWRHGLILACSRIGATVLRLIVKCSYVQRFSEDQ